MMTQRLLAVFTCLLLAGCATLEGKPTATSPCPFEQVWDTAIAALAWVRLQEADKAAGVLETAWVEVESATRAGLMQRDVIKERVRYVVEVKRKGTGAAATVLQLREAWSPMGVMMNRWRPVPGDPTQEAAVAAEIARRLKEKGC
jgi:hypothetical protein